ncbi:hypothetical protein B4U84_25825 [Westiellopsis prolifica IICB1]|nr:hypothetical protein B4U84_25825 [Westiellopsis prolifica IICB1]
MKSIQLDEAFIETYLASENQAFILGIQAYIWGYALVETEKLIQRATSVEKPFEEYAPLNQWGFATKLGDPTQRDIASINVDTLYSSAWLDLTEEPMVLEFPDHGDRYFFFQIADIRTEVIDNIGTRTRGSGAGVYALVAPNWEGELPNGMEQVRATSNVVWVMVRTLVKGEEDLTNARTLQQQYTLTPLSEYGKAEPDRLKRVTHYRGKKVPTNSSVPPQLRFYEALGIVMQNIPILPQEKALIDQFAQIGLNAEVGFDYESLTFATKMGLAQAISVGKQIVAAKEKNLGITNNGWSYNLQTGRFGTDYLLRSAIFKAFPFVTVPEEAIYPMVRTDEQGETLNGSRCYLLKLEKVPPVKGFWSLTVYDQDGFLVENPIRRYAIGDRTKGLKYGEDGSLEVYLQHEQLKNKESNWLPVPFGEFYLVLRAFYPKSELLDGTYEFPPIQRVGAEILN